MVDRRHPAELTRVARGRGLRKGRAAAAKAVWSNPVRRKARLGRMKREQVRHVGESLMHRGGVQVLASGAFKGGYTADGEGEPYVQRLRRLSPRVRRLVYALLDPVYAKAPIGQLAEVSGCPQKVVRRAMLHSEAFWPLVDGLRKVAFRYHRHRLAGKIVADAMTSLEEVHPAKASALIAMQEQAACIVGLEVEAPKVELTADVSVDGELAAIRKRLKITSGGEKAS